MRASTAVRAGLVAALALAAGAALPAPRVLSAKEFRARTGSSDRELYQAYRQKALAGPPPKPPPPQSVGDALKVTADSFFLTGSVGLVYRGLLSPTGIRTGKPVAAARAAVMTAQRWGRLSAGFAGGTAFAVVLLNRGEEDQLARLVGAAVGGIAAVSKAEQIPSSVATFVAFTYFMGRLTDGQAQAMGSERMQRRVERAQKAAVDGLRLLR